MAYKSVRLLVDALHKEMDGMRKLLMGASPGAVTDDGQTALETMNVLRTLFDELAAFADRPTLEDVLNQKPTDYVATMKPLVAKYHRQLMVADLLTPALCEDLQATGCVMILVGDGKLIVRTAHDPARPEIALAIDALLASLDSGMKQLMEQGIDEAEKMQGVPAPDQTECKVALGLMEPDPRSGGCDQPTCMRCYPEPGDPPLPPLEFTPCQGQHDEPCNDPDCYVLKQRQESP